MYHITGSSIGMKGRPDLGIYTAFQYDRRGWAVKRESDGIIIGWGMSSKRQATRFIKEILEANAEV